MTSLPQIYLARHGETAWSLSGQHTGRSEILLTPKGEEDALKIGARLKGINFTKIYSSPRQRAIRTCELAGFKSKMTILPEVAEWDYGDYEGKTTKEIRRSNPSWNLFKDGCPRGESPQQIGARADVVVNLIKKEEGNVLIFSHGHFLRVLAARWLAMSAENARYFLLDTSSVSILGYEHTLEDSVICLWNDTSHIKD